MHNFQPVPCATAPVRPEHLSPYSRRAYSTHLTKTSRPQLQGRTAAPVKREHLSPDNGGARAQGHDVFHDGLALALDRDHAGNLDDGVDGCIREMALRARDAVLDCAPGVR